MSLCDEHSVTSNLPSTVKDHFRATCIGVPWPHEGSRDHVGWSLTGNRKQKNMSNFWPKNWSQSLKKFEQWSLTRELLEQFLTEKQNGYLQSGRLREVVAMRELTVCTNTKSCFDCVDGKECVTRCQFCHASWMPTSLFVTSNYLINKCL